MGAILYDFPSLPADNDPEKTRLYAGVYADLQALGLPVPAAAPAVISRAALVAHLQAQAGELIKGELTADPDGVYTGGPDDTELARRISNDYVPPQARRFPGSHPSGYVVQAGSTANVITLLQNPGLGNPGFLGMNGLSPAVALRFRNNVAAVANRGAHMRLLSVNADTVLALEAPFPAVPVVGDICDLGFALPERLPARLGQILRRFPYGPNALTRDDVTAAKV